MFPFRGESTLVLDGEVSKGVAFGALVGRKFSFVLVGRMGVSVV